MVEMKYMGNQISKLPGTQKKHSCRPYVKGAGGYFFRSVRALNTCGLVRLARALNLLYVACMVQEESSQGHQFGSGQSEL